MGCEEFIAVSGTLKPKILYCSWLPQISNNKVTWNTISQFLQVVFWNYKTFSNSTSKSCLMCVREGVCFAEYIVFNNSYQHICVLNKTSTELEQKSVLWAVSARLSFYDFCARRYKWVKRSHSWNREISKTKLNLELFCHWSGWSIVCFRKMVHWCYIGGYRVWVGVLMLYQMIIVSSGRLHYIRHWYQHLSVIWVA